MADLWRPALAGVGEMLVDQPRRNIPQHGMAETMKRRESDVFKAIEGAGYCLTLEADPGLRKRIDAFITRIAAAQEPDGYLSMFRTMHPDAPVDNRMHAERWLEDPRQSHELYNLGHLLAAGAAHAQATGSDALLEVCLKAAEWLPKEFADGDPRIPPGQQGIEMALVTLHEKTGDPRWLDLAKLFLDARGGGSPTIRITSRLRPSARPEGTPSAPITWTPAWPTWPRSRGSRVTWRRSPRSGTTR